VLGHLIIPEEILNEVIKHAKASYPKEACGLLAGKEGVVSAHYPITNIDDSSVSYTMMPKEQMRALRDISKRSLEIVSIYHSHPSAPVYPSVIDIERAFFPGTKEENYPSVSYLIISLLGGIDIRAFLIEKGGVREIEIKII